MAIYLLRDYVTQNTTTGNRTYISSYLGSIFLRRILEYTYIGDTNFPINAVGTLLIATGDTSPTVAPTFPGGSKAGITNNGAAVEISIPPSVKGVQTTDVGRILFLKSAKYPTRNSGAFLITALQQGNITTIAAGSNGQSLPQSTINVASTAGFPASGNIFIGTVTVVASASNAISLPTGTINVTSTTGFPASGSLLVGTSNGPQTVSYTGITGTTFTGCTGGTGAMFTGATITTSAGVQTIAYTSIVGSTFQGCTGGTGTLVASESVYNQNKYVVDYRGNGDLSLTEVADTLPWYLYDKDINCPTLGSNNTAGGYRGNGNSTTPRIILQSPHSTGWQVRICNETSTDSLSSFNSPMISFAPGFGGNSVGDFPIGGQHLHGGLYWDTTSFYFNSGCGVGDNAGAGPIYRYTFMGDDTGQGVSLFARRPLNATSPPAFNLHFGIPSNEPTPLPLNNTCRLFILGSAFTDVAGNNRLSDISLSAGCFGGTATQGGAFSIYNQGPKSCSPSLLTYVTGVSQGAGPAFDASAGDSPFTSTTELMTIDLVTGTTPNWHSISAATIGLPYEPRAIGTLPFTFAGRTNFGDFTLTTDSATFTVSTASNATPIQITTTAANTLVTGQTVAISDVAGNTAANGTFTVTVINNTNFTLDGSVGNGAYVSGGTILRGASYQHFRRGVYVPWNGPSIVP